MDTENNKEILENANKQIAELEEVINKLKSNSILAATLPVDLNAVLRLDEPYSLPEVLSGLVECADILLHVRNYDRMGWERLEYCYRHGKEILLVLNPEY